MKLIWRILFIWLVSFVIANCNSDIPVQNETSEGNTLLENTLQASQVATLAEMPSEVLETENEATGVYFFDFDFRIYGFIPKDSSPLFLHSLNQPSNKLSKEGPGFALFGSFANFRDLVGYWLPFEDGGELWISDLALNEPMQVYKDKEREYEFTNLFPFNEATLFWTPDDKHLIVDVVEPEAIDLIYSVDENAISQWDYDCIGLAISPETDKVSVYCVSSHQIPDSFAYIEWGGEISYSETEATQVITQQNDLPAQLWAWSQDGQKVAYFENPEGTFQIIDSFGNPTTDPIQGLGYWLTNIPSYIDFQLAQWSPDNNFLVIYGVANSQPPCDKIPCWQILDANTGERVWDLSEIASEIEPIIEIISPIDFSPVAISGSNKNIYMTSVIGSDRDYYVIDFEKNEVLFSGDFTLNIMHWGYYP